MRKDALKKLLKRYPSFRSWVLNKALEEKPFALQPDDQDIAFSDVVQFFDQHGFQPNGSAKEMVKQYSDTDLFYFFIAGKTIQEMKEEDHRIIFNRAPNAVLDFTLAPMLDAKSVANLSSCSSALYQRTTSKWSYWKDKLITKGVGEEVINKVIQANVIQNYKKLYRTILRFEYKFRKRLNSWEIFCLSGEPKAIIYAIQNENLTRETKGLFGRNALHNAALSGSVEAMRYAIEILKIPATSTEKNGANALHNAAWSGSVEAMRYAIEILKIPATSTEKNGANALHYAALSGSVEAMRYAIETLKIPATSTENNGRNALHNAALSGSVEAMRYAIETLKIPATSTENNGRNALHYAALSGSVEAMRYAIETLKIPATSTENNGRDALHYAALSGSVEAMRYAIETLKIPATSTENNGANALHYAAWSGSVEAMRYAIETLKIPATSTENNGRNALHYAALSGSVEAMRYAIETLKIPATSTENNGANALHYAALSGSVEAVLFVRRLSFEFNLKLEPSVRDNGGHDAFWYADKTARAAAVKEILNMPIQKLLSQPETKKIELESKLEQKNDKRKPKDNSDSSESQKKCIVM